MLPAVSSFGEENNRPPEHDPWNGHFAKPTISAEEAARCGTPDMDSDEGAWISHGPDPQGNAGPGMPHRSPITYRPCKGGCPLIRVWPGITSIVSILKAFSIAWGGVD